MAEGDIQDAPFPKYSPLLVAIVLFLLQFFKTLPLRLLLLNNTPYNNQTIH